MANSTPRRILGIGMAALLSFGGAAAAEVTGDRLLQAAEEPQNWLMNLGGYEGHRFSGLDQITRENVGGLVVRYSVSIGGLMDAAGNYSAALPASPLVEDGFLYIVDGWGAVSKLDLGNEGAVVWRSDAGQKNLDAWLQASRGLAFHGHSLISISADGQLHWLSKDTGEITRSVQVGDPLEGYTISAPPLVVGGTIIVGGSGVDRGARSQIDAFNAVTGERKWTTYPAPAGSAGGAFLQTGVYDAASNTVIWGASHPFPRFQAAGGEALGFGNAVLALNVDTGEIRWTYGYPHRTDTDVSEAGTYQLIPSGAASSEQAALLHFGNDGLFYVFDLARRQPRLAVPFLPEAPQAKPTMPDPAATAESSALPSRPGCPNIRSTPAFAAAFSPRTGLAYGAGADACHPDVRPIVTAATSGWLGAYYAGADAAMGMLSAMDPVTGTPAAQRLFNFPVHAGVLATAGGLVFTTTADGSLYALDDQTLETLWSSKFASLAPIPPISFAVDGEQFIAVVVGGNAFAKELSYRPPEAGLSQDLFVVIVIGQRA